MPKSQQRTAIESAVTPSVLRALVGVAAFVLTVLAMAILFRDNLPPQHHLVGLCITVPISSLSLVLMYTGIRNAIAAGFEAYDKVKSAEHSRS